METNRKGQVTIFIIIGVLIFVAILLVFYFTGSISFTKSNIQNPEAYLESCMINSAKEAENLIFNSNGYPQLESNYILYNTEKVPYLCISSEFYNPCIPQEPAFFSYINKIIENKVARDTQICVDNLVSELENKGYEVQINSENTTVEIRKDFVNVQLGKTVYFSNGEDSRQIQNLQFSYGTKLYDMIKLVQTIVNSETSTCDFDKEAWMRMDNSIIIFKDSTSDQTEVYTLKERLTEREIKFAIKTCVLPAAL
jgi:hypothetical protein